MNTTEEESRPEQLFNNLLDAWKNSSRPQLFSSSTIAEVTGLPEDTVIKLMSEQKGFKTTRSCGRKLMWRSVRRLSVPPQDESQISTHDMLNLSHRDEEPASPVKTPSQDGQDFEANKTWQRLLRPFGRRSRR
jgi:hypothetical protein